MVNCQRKCGTRLNITPTMGSSRYQPSYNVAVKATASYNINSNKSRYPKGQKDGCSSGVRHYYAFSVSPRKSACVVPNGLRTAYSSDFHRLTIWGGSHSFINAGEYGASYRSLCRTWCSSYMCLHYRTADIGRRFRSTARYENW